MQSNKTGVWVIGALGSLGTTIVAGTRGIARGLSASTGLLTERPELAPLELPALQDLVFGGHDVRRGDLVTAAHDIHRQNGSLGYQLLQELESDLSNISREIRPGTAQGGGDAIEGLAEVPAAHASSRELVESLVRDLEEFRTRHSLARLIVVNLSSTEPPTDWTDAYRDRDALEAALDSTPPGTLRPGLLYTYAAFRAGAAYLNFTPSNSSLCPATESLAAEQQVPFMGNDGKTGETLVKSALAPMFKYRGLTVDSWMGYNLLGNRDGEVLAREENRQSKVESKDSVLSSILGYPLHSHVGIDYVPSLEDRKVAWDFIHFRGFLDYRMSMQFTWHGCDSILAAPVVLDLVRFADVALKRNESGPLLHLASFFKSPVHCEEHDLHAQFHRLTDYLSDSSHGSSSDPKAKH